MALLKHAMGIKLIFFLFLYLVWDSGKLFWLLSPLIQHQNTQGRGGTTATVSKPTTTGCRRPHALLSHRGCRGPWLHGALSAEGWLLDTACPCVLYPLARAAVMAHLPCAPEVRGFFWWWAACQDPQIHLVSSSCLAGVPSQTLMPEPAVVEQCFASFHFLF